MTTTTTLRDLQDLEGASVYDRDHSKIGVIDEIFTDDSTNRPEFIGIGTGFLRMSRALVPVESAKIVDGEVTVPYEKGTVKDSPDVDGDVIERDEARALYDHYGLTGAMETGEDTPTEPRETTKGEQAEVTRHEEQVNVGKRDVDAGSVRLRKWVETESVDTDVELEREHAEVERESVDEPASGGNIGEEDVEVQLREQEPVVEKETRAKEHVEIDKDVEHDSEQVSETVRKERVEVEDDTR